MCIWPLQSLRDAPQKSSFRTAGHPVTSLARPRELVIGAEPHSAAHEVALDCPAPGTMTTWALSPIQTADWWAQGWVPWKPCILASVYLYGVVLASGQPSESWQTAVQSKESYPPEPLGESPPFQCACAVRVVKRAGMGECDCTHRPRDLLLGSLNPEGEE